MTKDFACQDWISAFSPAEPPETSKLTCDKPQKMFRQQKKKKFAQKKVEIGNNFGSLKM